VPGPQSVGIGPWIGGLNTYSDPSAVADNEAIVIENFELDLDGSLLSRPPIQDLAIGFPLGASGNVLYLGYFYGSGNVPFLLASDGLSSTYYFNGTSWVLVTNTIAAAAMCQFNGKAWLAAPVGSANPGGSWDPTGGFVADANMPKGEILVAYKNRLWMAPGRDSVSNGTRLYFSAVIGATPFWPVAPNFIDIGSGDGQNIVQLRVYYSTLLVGRTNSWYSFQYTSDPASGVVSVILPGIGLADKDCLVASDAYLYFMYEEKAYEFINNRAQRINEKVPFNANIRTGIYKPYAVSTFNNRIVFSYYDTMFIFSLKTRTWTTWKSPSRGPIGKLIELAGTAQAQAIAHSSSAVASGGSRTASTYQITDTISTVTETFQCTLQTKNYSYEAVSSYKRLFWWGADSTFRGRVTAVVAPIVFNQAVTWAQLLPHKWDELLNYRWDQPLTGTLSVQTVRDTTGSGSIRKFVKFAKSLFFRQVNFKVVFDTDGSINTAPVRLFKLSTFVTLKNTVSKAVT
jgi:hypothetical protein